MVNSGVIIKRRKNYFKLFFKSFLIFFLLFILFYLGHIIFSSFEKTNNTIILNNPLDGVLKELNQDNLTNNNLSLESILSKAEKEFNQTYINYMLYAIGAGCLHDNPLSRKNPKILFKVGEDYYTSTIVNKNIFTEKSFSDSVDISVITSKKEVILAMVSDDLGEYMKESISNGLTVIEMKGSLTDLIAKGYVSMYEELTDEKFIG